MVVARKNVHSRLKHAVKGMQLIDDKAPRPYRTTTISHASSPLMIVVPGSWLSVCKPDNEKEGHEDGGVTNVKEENGRTNNNKSTFLQKKKVVDYFIVFQKAEKRHWNMSSEDFSKVSFQEFGSKSKRYHNIRLRLYSKLKVFQSSSNFSSNIWLDLEMSLRVKILEFPIRSPLDKTVHRNALTDFMPNSWAVLPSLLHGRKINEG